MVRTQVQLTDQQAEALRRKSKRENVSVAELVGQAIDVFTRTEPPSDQGFGTARFGLLDDLRLECTTRRAVTTMRWRRRLDPHLREQGFELA